jgi:Bacterial toxin 50
LIDFGEVIGYNVDLNGIKTITTWGKIHYSKTGAHIVPTIPKK